MTLALINDTQLIETLNSRQNPFFSDYFAFYSSWFGGVTQNPALMLLPIDDHMVHRGDGVFEAMKVINRSVYLMDEHLERLFYSAEKIQITPPFSLAETKQIVLDTLAIANHADASIRVFLSRGPGNFTVNPYDSIGPQLYVAIIRLKTLSENHYTQGVKIGISEIPIKVSWMTRVKSCNYLSNVLMKKEAVDRNLDFVIVVDDNGFITEGATENIMIVDQQGTLVYPQLANILKGTTLMRACELGTKHGLRSEERSISIDELKSAQEVMMTGTTLDILPVTQVEDTIIGDGKPGPIAIKLRELIVNDLKNGPKRTTF